MLTVLAVVGVTFGGFAWGCWYWFVTHPEEQARAEHIANLSQRLEQAQIAADALKREVREQGR